MKRQRQVGCECKYCECPNTKENDRICQNCGTLVCEDCNRDCDDVPSGLCQFCKDVAPEVKSFSGNKVNCGNCDETFLQEYCVKCLQPGCKKWYCAVCDNDLKGAIWIAEGEYSCVDCATEPPCCPTWILHIGKCDPENCKGARRGRNTGKSVKERNICCFVAGEPPCSACADYTIPEDDLPPPIWGPVNVKVGDNKTAAVMYSMSFFDCVVPDGIVKDILSNTPFLDATLREVSNAAGRGFGAQTNKETRYSPYILKHGYDTLVVEADGECNSLWIAVGDGARPVRFTKDGGTSLNMIPSPCVYQMMGGTRREYPRVEEEAFESAFLPLCPDTNKPTHEKAEWLWENREHIKPKLSPEDLSKFETWCKPHIFWKV